MAGFETIVRPMILPNIRPAPARPVAPGDDPEQGKCVISGQDAGTITSSYSRNVSIQKASATEQKRTFDEVRITPKKGGSGGRPTPVAAAATNDVYIDVEVVTKLALKGSDGKKFTRHYAPMEESANVEILRRDVTRSSDL